MAAAQGEDPRGDQTEPELRVRVTSKKRLIEQMSEYKEVLKQVLDGQDGLDQETRRVLIQELLANFEAAVQDNVLVNGQTWEEAPDVEDHQDLESQLDDAVVEASRRRRSFPRKILPHVVHTLKAQRKLMGLYESSVSAQEAMKDPTQESVMTELSAATPALVTQTIQAIKSIRRLQSQAEGVCQVLHMQPSQASLEIHREVLGAVDQSDAPPGATRSRRPLKRAVEEASTAAAYVSGAKKPPCPLGAGAP